MPKRKVYVNKSSNRRFLARVLGYRFSKNLTAGDLCTFIKCKDHIKVIRCSSNKRVHGAYVPKGENRYIIKDGSVVKVQIPEGVQVLGYVQIKTGR